MYLYGSVTPKDVHDRAHGVLHEVFSFRDYGRTCAASMLISLLLYAAARGIAISAACQRLRGAPSDETARKALMATLPELSELERRINAGLTIHLPRALARRRWPIAIDLHEIPYCGRPQHDAEELRRGKSKKGTTRFHCYATACVVRKGYRFTLGVTWVRYGESMTDVLQRLLPQVRRNGVRIKHLLLDRGFYCVDVIRYLQHARCPFIMPVVHRGRAPKDPARARGTRRFLNWRKSGWSTHRWRNPQGRQATVSIAVSLRYYKHKGKRRRQVLVFACWGISGHSTAAIRETYRKRFGIETSYRQLGQARIRTSTADPLRRLLCVGLALILRNIWAWIHLVLLGTRHGLGVRLYLPVMTLNDMLNAIKNLIETLLGLLEVFSIEPQPPPKVTAMAIM